MLSTWFNVSSKYTNNKFGIIEVASDAGSTDVALIGSTHWSKGINKYIKTQNYP